MPDSKNTAFISPDALFAQWQGHRTLTRRVIDAFPDDQFATFQVGGMRTAAQLGHEIVTMGVPMLHGLVTGEWRYEKTEPGDKATLLRRWDEATVELDRLFRQIPPEKFPETMTAFGQYTDALHNLILYVIDNEIHHRGQLYVYLRALGVEPPPFYERG